MDMKKLFLALGVCAVMGISALSAQQVKFEDYFLNKTMRFDFYHAGDANS